MISQVHEYLKASKKPSWQYRFLMELVAVKVEVES